MITLDNIIISTDGTRKFLWRLDNESRFVESILVYVENRTPSSVICVSTQVGCNVGCKFCATGKHKFHRSLTANEIFSQVSTIVDNPVFRFANEPFQVSFMGMGEPLLNYDAVVETVRMCQEHYSNCRILCISTVGITPNIERLSSEEFTVPVRLQISLHSSNDFKRIKIIPINSLYSIQQVLNSGKEYAISTNSKVCINYMLFSGFNDSDDDISALIKLLDRELFYVKLSQFNPLQSKNNDLTPSKRTRDIERKLQANGIQAKIFKSKGRDIGAGCGQLSVVSMGNTRSDN